MPFVIMFGLLGALYLMASQGAAARKTKDVELQAGWLYRLVATIEPRPSASEVAALEQGLVVMGAQDITIKDMGDKARVTYVAPALADGIITLGEPTAMLGTEVVFVKVTKLGKANALPGHPIDWTPPTIPPGTIPEIPTYDPSDPFYLPAERSPGQPTSFALVQDAPAGAPQYSPDYLTWVFYDALASFDPNILLTAAGYLGEAYEKRQGGSRDSGLDQWGTLRWGPLPYIEVLEQLESALDHTPAPPEMTEGAAEAVDQNNVELFNQILAEYRDDFPEAAAAVRDMGMVLAGLVNV